MCETYDMELIHVGDQFEREMIRDLVASCPDLAFPSTVWVLAGDMNLPAKYLISLCFC